MGVKEQLGSIKNNWLIIVVVIVLLLFMNFGGVSNSFQSLESGAYKGINGYGITSADSMGYMPSNDDFAPEVEARKIIKTASMSAEIERGNFQSAEQALTTIVSSTDSFVLSENVNKYGTGKTAYFYGHYQITVETDKYDVLISNLKELGEVTSFSENSRDVTGQYTNAEVNLELEQERLERYQEMYDDAVTVTDKITLNDKIFQQERTVKYLKEAIDKIDQKIEYSTVYFTMTEERSNYANVAFVGFSNLVKSLVSSINGLLSFIFVILPWVIAIAIVMAVWKLVKKK